MAALPICQPPPRCCATCANFLRESDAPTMDGEPDTSWVSDFGVCVSRLVSTCADDQCGAWFEDGGEPAPEPRTARSPP